MRQGMLDRLFQLEANNTSVKTEVIAGLTTFMTMVYIIFVNPDVLSSVGMNWNGVFIAVVVASTVGTLIMAFATNYPFALAPGLGALTYFAFGIIVSMGVPWQTALGLLFLEGILFMVLSLTSFRTMLINCIPVSLKAAIGAGIGLFIAFIGARNAGLVVADPNTFVAVGSVKDP